MKETDAGTATRRTGPRSSAAPPGGKERARRSRSRKVARNGAAARAPWGRPAGSGRAGRRSRIGGTPVKYGDPQFQDGLGSFEPPSRACDVHSVLDDVPAGALDDPGGDGPALPERGGVVQVVLLVVQVAGALVGAGPLGGRVPVGGGAAADPGRDLGGFAVQDLAGLGGDPFLGRGLALVEK